MNDSIRRIQQDGYSKPLLELANRWRTQNSCAEYIKKDNDHFYLKNCERLRELKIGRVSFSDYSLCEISNLPLLEAIEMGEWNDSSDSFMYASLELKSNCFMKE